jgi:Co/Zn/Cd efflux system component
MLLTSVMGVLLNIVLAWILAGGGCKMFKDILMGIIFGVKENKSTKKSKSSSVFDIIERIGRIRRGQGRNEDH